MRDPGLLEALVEREQGRLARRLEGDGVDAGREGARRGFAGGVQHLRDQMAKRQVATGDYIVIQDFRLRVPEAV